MHLWEVIPAPTKAQVTEAQSTKQLKNPNFPYLQMFNEKPPNAHSGAITQKMII